jgi:hypothetical protein
MLANRAVSTDILDHGEAVQLVRFARPAFATKDVEILLVLRHTLRGEHRGRVNVHKIARLGHEGAGLTDLAAEDRDLVMR